MRTALQIAVVLIVVFSMTTLQALAGTTECHGVENPDSNAINYSPGLAPPLHGYRSDLKGAEKEAQRSLIRQFTLAEAKLGRFIKNSNEDWHNVDTKVREELKRWESHEFFYSIAQSVSGNMLWGRLLDDGVYTKDKKEAIAYYVRLALDNYHPDSELFSIALPILQADGFWSTEQVAEAAYRARGFALTFLYLKDKKPNRTKDILEESKSPSGCIDAESLKHHKMREALTVLDSLATL